MSVLVVAVPPAPRRSSCSSGCPRPAPTGDKLRRRRRRLRARRRGVGARHLQPRRDLRRGRPVPRRRRRRLAAAASAPTGRAAPSRTCRRTSTSTTRTGAVAHLFAVACGLDSMVVGEGQILGQVREALRRGAGRPAPSAGPQRAVQQALRVGKRAHAETGIDRPARRSCRLALDAAPAALGDARRAPGSSSSAPARWRARGGHRDAGSAPREHRGRQPHARRTRAGWRERRRRARAARWTAVRTALADVDVLISCTGATGVVARPPTVLAAARAGAERPLVVIDLALPRDVDPAVAELARRHADRPRAARRPTRHRRASRRRRRGRSDDRRRARSPRSWPRAARATRGARPSSPCAPWPTGVVDAELSRLDARLPDLDPAARAEIAHAVRRVVDKLLHEPTVRVKELAERAPAPTPTPTRCAELFDLDPDAVEAVTPPRASTPSRALDERPATPHRCGSAPAQSRSRCTQSEQVADALRDATGPSPSSWSRSPPRATSPRRRSPQIGGTGRLRRRPARRAAAPARSTSRCTRSRTCRRGRTDRLALAAVPQREDPRDALVARDGLTLGELPAGARVGTGSPRRAAQLRALGLGLDVVADPRQRRHPARARSPRRARRRRPRPRRPRPARPARRSHRGARPDRRCCPRPGQGALAVECRATDRDLGDSGSRRCSTTAAAGLAVTAERAVLRRARGRLLRAGRGRWPSVAEGDDGPTSCTSGRSRCPATAASPYGRPPPAHRRRRGGRPQPGGRAARRRRRSGRGAAP